MEGYILLLIRLTEKGTLKKCCLRILWQLIHFVFQAELTAGIYNTEDRDGYLPTVSMLADLGASLHVAGADTLNSKQPSEANCNPETLHAQIRACAAAFQVPIGVQNTGSMKDDSSWDRLLQVVLDESRYRSINLPLVRIILRTKIQCI